MFIQTSYLISKIPFEKFTLAIWISISCFEWPHSWPKYSKLPSIPVWRTWRRVPDLSYRCGSFQHPGHGYSKLQYLHGKSGTIFRPRRFHLQGRKMVPLPGQWALGNKAYANVQDEMQCSFWTCFEILKINSRCLCANKLHKCKYLISD